MKKVIFSLAILASVALVACNKANNKDSESNAAAPAATEETNVAAAEETVVEEVKESNVAAPAEAEAAAPAEAEAAAPAAAPAK